MFRKTLNVFWFLYWFLCCPLVGAYQHVPNPYVRMVSQMAWLLFWGTATAVTLCVGVNDIAKLVVILRKSAVCQLVAYVGLHTFVGLLIVAGFDGWARSKL